MDVKICGLSDAASLTRAVEGGARWVGFVCFPPSPRHIAPERVADLAAVAKGRAETVAVLVDPDDRLVTALAPHCDWLQLHGEESVARATDIRRLTGRRIIKAVKVATADDIDAARAYEAVADMLLFDARPAPDATLPGGNGLAFDWPLLRGRAFRLPWMLSGGLDAASLGQAVGQSGARAVDISSGVEDAPGKKNLDKITAFLEEAGRIAVKEQ